MKASNMLIGTLKEAPNEAIISSHILLLRAGMIKKLVAGVYNYLPLGLRTLRKIENIIREEMDKAGCNEILSSALQPKEFWVESGRWEKYGPELMRLKDRHEREFCLGPTHEEVFTDIARQMLKSPKMLPMNIYQIQTKYRDELRPRFGLMRGREFIMKDAYSFDKDEEGLEKSYQNMYNAYNSVFTRFGLNYRAVLADTGAIGGNGSHQFMALSEVGESNICYCDKCHYAADQEKAESKNTEPISNEKMKEIELFETPGVGTIDELAKFLNVKQSELVKSLVYHDYQNDQVVLVLLRGDRELNEIKLVNALNTVEHQLAMATPEDLEKIKTVHGYIGPQGLNVRILADLEVGNMKNLIVGANKEGYHAKNVNFDRDFKAEIVDLRVVVEGDLCPLCGSPMKVERGIEVGQIFKLQTKYSKAMNCVYQNEKGESIPMVMGCYGIGVTRTMSAIVEQYHDEFGIKWPLNVAPYHAVVVPINAKDETQYNLANEIYENLKKNNVEVIFDDRDAKPGFKFKDWELIGIPYMIIVGRRASENIVELKYRQTNEKVEINNNDAVSQIVENVKNI